MGIIGVTIWVIVVINLLSKSPRPSKKGSTAAHLGASGLTRRGSSNDLIPIQGPREANTP